MENIDDLDIDIILLEELNCIINGFIGDVYITIHCCFYAFMSKQFLKNLGLHTTFENVGVLLGQV